MAVTKIRKTSSYTLLCLIAVTIAVILIFFLGGSVETAKGNTSYNQTSVLIVWTYLLFAITVLAAISFGIASFINKLMHNPKKALMSLSGVVLLLGVFALSYFVLGDGTPLKTINADNQTFNTYYWLKITDMWLYSIYIMFALVILAVIWGSLRKLFSK